MANEYDEDIFTLEEDLEEAERRRKIRHAVLSVLALVMVTVALVLSVYLTKSRVARQAVEKETLLVRQEAERKALDVNYWPEEQFPNMPVFTAPEYKTTQENGKADIVVASTAAAGFSEYKAELLEGGAQLLIDTTKLTVLLYDDVEVHLVNETSGTRVVFCGESGIVWDGEGYEGFPLMEGRLVSVAEGVSAGSRVLTYRAASVADALDFVNELVVKGWVAVHELSVVDNRFLVSLKLDNRQITVDYFQSGDNFTVRLEYLG
ncbi:MAG: hypothetical protein ACOYI8_01775 [Christensenellales bacterium]|jgi:hypothetical protein